MKFRKGFVTNSSSSSFLIQLKDLTPHQLYSIANHEKETDDPWSIVIKDGIMHGSTDMDNFDMENYMKKLGVDMDKVEFDGNNY